MSTVTRFLLLACVSLATACGSARQMPAATMEPLAIQAAERAPLRENHFKQDKTGNLTEQQLRDILASPVYLEEDTRLGIVPVATAYEASTDVPVSQIPAQLSGALERTGFFDVTTEVSTDWPADGSIAGLRELAARYRAKYLLLYRHRFVERDRVNAWGWTYPTIIGALVTPGTTYEVAGVMEATLFDPRTGTILFTAFERVEGRRTMNVWNPEVKRDQLKEELLLDASERLSQTVTDKVRRLVAARPEPSDARLSSR